MKRKALGVPGEGLSELGTPTSQEGIFGECLIMVRG